LKGIVGFLAASSIFTTAYVLINGLEEVYELFGTSLAVTGGTATGAGFAVLVASGAIAVGMAEQRHWSNGKGGIEPPNPQLRPLPMVLAVLLLGWAGYLVWTERSLVLLDRLEVGDCFNDPADPDFFTPRPPSPRRVGRTGIGDVKAVEVIPCDDPHDYELIAVATVENVGSASPGDEAVQEAAFLPCLIHFAGYVGADYEQSTLEILAFTPTRESGEQAGDQAVYCGVFRRDFDGLVESVGSVRGTG
jgi:hypothetical protein